MMSRITYSILKGTTCSANVVLYVQLFDRICIYTLNNRTFHLLHDTFESPDK